MIERQPEFAEIHFRLARLLEQAGALQEAYREYILARDLDGHPTRCPTAFQDVYRSLAPRYGAILVDGQAVFHARHPHGLLDDYLFNDGMHPSLEGQVALAEAVLAGLKEHHALGWPASCPVSLHRAGRLRQSLRPHSGRLESGLPLHCGILPDDAAHQV